MTNREYIQTIGRRFGMSDEDVAVLILSQNIEADADADVKACKIAMCHEFATLIPMQSVSEGGYSVSWNMDAVKLWYKVTCAEMGITDGTQPRVRNRSCVW